MNPIIKKQLNNCKVANVPPFSDDNIVVHIPKGAILPVSIYEVGQCYVVELSDYLLNPPVGSTLSSNWNNGTIPLYKYYKCEIKKVMGKMVFILGVGYDPVNNVDSSDLWEGWVPQSDIKLLQKLS